MKRVEGGEGGFLSFVSCLQILLFLNISFIVHFWMMVGVTQWLLFVDVRPIRCLCMKDQLYLYYVYIQ